SFSGCSDGMVNIVSCKDRCSLSQSVIWSAAQANSIRTHTNYIQNNAADPLGATGPSILENNIFAWGGGAGDCECISGGFIDNNLWVRNAINIGIGKGQPMASWIEAPTLVKNNVILEGKYLESYDGDSAAGSRAWGMALRSPYNSATFSNNIIFHSAQLDHTNEAGFLLESDFGTATINGSPAVVSMIANSLSFHPYPAL